MDANFLAMIKESEEDESGRSAKESVDLDVYLGLADVPAIE